MHGIHLQIGLLIPCLWWEYSSGSGCLKGCNDSSFLHALETTYQIYSQRSHQSPSHELWANGNSNNLIKEGRNIQHRIGGQAYTTIRKNCYVIKCAGALGKAWKSTNRYFDHCSRSYNLYKVSNSQSLDLYRHLCSHSRKTHENCLTAILTTALEATPVNKFPIVNFRSVHPWGLHRWPWVMEVCWSQWFQ